MSKLVYFDNRWSGNNGIGRYSRELSRIASTLEMISIEGSQPTELSEIFKPLFHRGSKSLYYSPGYVARVFFSRQIITIHDLILLEKRVGSILHRLYFNHYLRNRVRRGRVHVVTVSLSSRTKISEWAGIPITRIDVIPNGISEEILRAGENLNPTARGRTLMFLGNLKRHKRFDLFVEAVNLLEGSYSITLVGPNLSAEAISDRHTVQLLHNVSDEALAEAYLHTNVVVVTSLHEGFCMPVLEGSYLGCKILHLGVLPTIEEIIGDASFSTLGSLDARVIAKEIEYASLAPNKMVEFDRRFLASRYSWDKSRDILRNLICGLQDDNCRSVRF
jgi:glycosyltransferase involved in cell wall biosynthesis